MNAALAPAPAQARPATALAGPVTQMRCAALDLVLHAGRGPADRRGRRRVRGRETVPGLGGASGRLRGVGQPVRHPGRPAGDRCARRAGVQRRIRDRDDSRVAGRGAIAVAGALGEADRAGGAGTPGDPPGRRGRILRRDSYPVGPGGFGDLAGRSGFIGVALGSLLRKTAAGLSAFAAVFFVGPIVVPHLPHAVAGIAPYLPSSAGGALWGQPLAAHPLSPWTGFALLCGYAAVLIGLAAWQLRRRDA